MSRRPRIAPIAFAALSTAVTVFPVSTAHAAIATWLGGAGSWSDLSKWSSDPNTATAVLIDNGNATSSTVIVDSVTNAGGVVPPVTVDVGDILNSNLTLFRPSGLTVNGTAGGKFSGDTSGLDITGTGTVDFDAMPGSFFLGVNGGHVGIGSGLTVKGPFTTTGGSSPLLLNAGAITLTGAGKSTTIGGQTQLSTNVNSGTMSAAGGATLTLYTFKNDVGGAINLTDSTLAIGLTAGGKAVFQNLGTLSLTNSVFTETTSSGAFALSSLGTVTATNSTIDLTGSVTNTGTFTVGNTDTLLLRGGAAPTISGGTLATTGSGKIVFNKNVFATNLTLDGNTDIDTPMLGTVTVGPHGVVHINNSQPALPNAAKVTIQAGGFVGGNTTLAGNITVAGTLSPGNSIGTFGLQTDATFQTGGHLAIELGNAGASDLLAVTGALNLSAPGDSLDLSQLPGTSFSFPYTIATAASITGTFDNVTPGYTLQYTPTSIIVVPEPATLTLLPLSSLVLVRRRRA
jgi:hypothetical protein